MVNNPNNINSLNNPSAIQNDSGIEDQNLEDEFRQELDNKRTEMKKINNQRIQSILDNMGEIFDDTHENDLENKKEINDNMNSIRKELDFDVNSI